MRKLKNWCFDDLNQRSGMCGVPPSVEGIEQVQTAKLLGVINFVSVILTLHLMLMMF